MLGARESEGIQASVDQINSGLLSQGIKSLLRLSET